jgi:hypothetical protein
MPQATVASSPNGHLVCANPTAPATRYRIGQVGERTTSHVEGFELAEQLAPYVRHEPGANLAGEAEIPSLVVADQERIHAARSRGTIAADYNFLLALEFQFHPISRALARLVRGIRALGDHSLETRGAHGFHNLRCAAGKLLRQA